MLIRKTGRVIALAIIGGLISGIVANGYQVVSANSPTQQKSNWVEMQTDYHSTYLPIVLDNFPPPQTFGVETSWNDPHQINMADEANAYWLRSTFFDWKSIQPQPTGYYYWDSVNEWALKEASSRGINIIATVKYTPLWAQKYRGVSCGPVAQDYLDEFAQFMVALVTRYGVPPYNVKHWEIGNEPDVDRRLVPPDNFYGCWGEINDRYYGGEYYAEMLKHVYPAVKAVDPNAKILIGGLLLDCDPTNPVPAGKNCRPANFLEGILRNNGGDYFDIVSFHGFTPYVGGLQLDEHNPIWGHRGGIVLGKADFLREVMREYGVDKPLFHSEASLLCPPPPNFLEEMERYGVENPLLYSKDALLLSSTSEFTCDPPDSQFYEAQADYVVWVYVRNIAAGIIGTTWYTLTGPGWVNGGLLDGSQEPRPAYYSFQFMAEELRNAVYRQRLWLYYDQYPFLRVYEFNKSGKRIWVMWASDEQPSSIILPGETTKVFNKYGDDITPTNSQITVKSPVYVELTP